MAVNFIMRKALGGFDKDGLDLRRSQGRICFEHLSHERRDDGRGERCAVDVFVVLGDDVLASDLERDDLANAVNRAVESG